MRTKIPQTRRGIAVGVWLAIFILSCSGSPGPLSGAGGFSSTPPLKLQSLGVPLSAYVVLSTDPSTRHPLTLDPATNSFRGEIEVPTGAAFDLTVVYLADDPVTRANLQVAHYLRRGLVASGSSMTVTYEGDEVNWETLFDLAPGTPNDLNLDGDPYNNFVEIGYGSDATSPASLPAGPPASASHKDPLFGTTDVSLPPPGADVTSSLKGEEEVTIEAVTPFGINGIEVVSPTYGVTILSTDDEVRAEKKIRLKVDTRRFVTGSGGMTLTVRVTDEYQIVRETTLTFAVFNGTDTLPPLELQLGLTDGQTVTDRTSFIWEIDDPSGIDFLSIRLIRPEAGVDEAIGASDEDPAGNRFRATVLLDVSRYQDGSYTVELSARDGAGNLYSETRGIEVVNTTKILPPRCGDGVIDRGEVCDDGNSTNTDSCTNLCQLARCGDGVTGPGEGCDDGNNIDTDSCTNICKTARCGDGITGPGEGCDDGNSIGTDACTNICQLARCGDGAIGPREVCDDGNSTNTDSCTNSCKTARCGDGVTGPGEGCDDGNNINTDSCTDVCQVSRCGDGVIGPGEGCDDGNNVNSDPCTNACQLARCGDGIVGVSDECDDGNVRGGDGCNTTCRIESPEIVVDSPAEGATVRDLVAVDATAVSRFGVPIQSFRVTDPVGVTDQNGLSDIFEAVWDTRLLREDQEQLLVFQARDQGNRASSVTRRVRVDNVPNITSFTTDPSLIQSGDSTTLSWEANNTSSLLLDNGIGGVPLAGSLGVAPTRTTTYTLTATRVNNLGTAPTSFASTSQVTVRVNYPPTPSLTTIPVGTVPESVVFNWINSNDTNDDAGCQENNRSDLAIEKVDGTPVALIAGLSGTSFAATSLTGDERLEPRTDYRWRITARDNCGGSTTSSWSPFTTGDNNLVGWWRFDGDANDSSGNNLNGSDDSPNNSPFSFESGSDISGSAISFAGNDYVRIAHNPILNNPRTLEIRFKPTGIGRDGLIDKFDGNGPEGGYFLDLLERSDNPVLYLTVGGGNAAYVGPVNFDQWNYLVAVRRDNEVFFYLNGRLTGADDLPTPVDLETTWDLVIGANRNSGGIQEYFEGLIDEVAIYNRTLTVDEIRQSCRRNDSTGTTCPDRREPIILTPLPNQVLPPTRAYWSWRGERNRDGSQAAPEVVRWNVYSDIDGDADGRFDPLDDDDRTGSQPLPVLSTSYHVIDISNASLQGNLRRLRVRPMNSSGNEIPGFESPRLFSTDDLVIGWWKFDEGSGTVAGDSAGNNDGTLMNELNLEGWTEGGIDGGLLFDGYNDYVDLTPSVSNLAFDSTDDFTVEARFRPAVIPSQSGTLFDIESDGGLLGASLGLSGSGRIWGWAGNAAGSAELFGLEVVVPGNFYHAGMVFDGGSPGSLSLSVNGEAQVSGNGPFSFTAGQFDVATIGAFLRGGNLQRPFQGLIDEVVVYDRALPLDVTRNNYCALEALAGTDPLPEVCTQ